MFTDYVITTYSLRGGKYHTLNINGVCNILPISEPSSCLYVDGKSCVNGCSVSSSSSIYVNMSNGCGGDFGTNLSLKVSCEVQTDKMPVSELSPVITGLTNSMNEFIPYVAYIGLGLLSVIIGFVAIKWLINRVRAKVLGTFKK